MKPLPLAEKDPPPAAAADEAGLYLRVSKRLPHFRMEVSLACRPGEVLCLVGPSGSGKTTLLRIIAGLIRPDFGVISHGGRVWADADGGLHLAPRRRGVGLVFQDYPLFPHQTLLENVAFAAAGPGLAWELMERFGIADLAGRRPAQVSGGERQRAAICQALARQPEVLLLDEPFSALDLDSRLNARRCFQELARERGICVLLVSHDLWDAAAAGRSAALVRGRLDPAWLAERLELVRQEAAGLLHGPALARIFHEGQASSVASPSHTSLPTSLALRCRRGYTFSAREAGRLVCGRLAGLDGAQNATSIQR